MNVRSLPGLVALALLAPASLAPAQFNRTALLVDAPTADVLPAGSFALSPIITVPRTRSSLDAGWDGDASLRFSPVDRLELALTAYTARDYVLGASYQLIRGGKWTVVRGLELRDTTERARPWIMESESDRLSLAVGVHDVGFHGYVSPLGNGTADAWPDWKYEYRPMENFSLFAVATLPVFGIARLHAGIGRGRYVGYCHGRFINTDFFFAERHQWAFGLFGGLDLNLGSNVVLAADFTGRDAGAGARVVVGPVTAAVGWSKAEGLIFPQQSRDQFGRFAFALSYRVDNLFGRRAPTVRTALPPPGGTLAELPGRAGRTTDGIH